MPAFYSSKYTPQIKDPDLRKKGREEVRPTYIIIVKVFGLRDALFNFQMRVAEFLVIISAWLLMEQALIHKFLLALCI